jgi:DNA-binding transcriptional ArsR family regulator
MPTEASALSGVSAETSSVLVSLEPVYNQLYSLLLLYKEARMPGLGDWVTRTREKMPLDQLQRNRLVMDGLFYAFTTLGGFPSLGAYLDHLESLPPQSFQDRLLAVYLAASPHGCSMKIPPAPDPEKRREILASADAYVRFLGQHFPPDHVDPDLEAQAYRYAIDPPAMKAVIIDHLRVMGETYLAPEWTRVRPMLTRSVEAFQESDLGAMSRREAIRFVVGRDVSEFTWSAQVDEAESVILAPSAHIGPYVGRFTSGGTLVVLFGARLPEGTRRDEPDISRTEILTRLDALSDDNRLRILRMAADGGELRATDVMTALDVSQSAASRSLTQLTATGYLVERRRDGGKSYSINQARIADTLDALARFLAVKGKDGTR